jgi:hypothetical protein
MDVPFKPETESRLRELAAVSGRAAGELIEDALAGYLTEMADVRNTINRRYDDLKSGRVQAIEGDKAFDQLRLENKNRHP